MKTFLKHLGTMSFLLLLAAFSGGCTSLQSVSVTSVPRHRGRPVQASENNVAFLGIHFDNEFVDELPARLRAQCPGGKVVGMFTKYETTWYVLVSDRDVIVKGYCVYEEPVRRAKVQEPSPPIEPPPAPRKPPPPPERAARTSTQRGAT